MKSLLSGTKTCEFTKKILRQIGKNFEFKIDHITTKFFAETLEKKKPEKSFLSDQISVVLKLDFLRKLITQKKKKRKSIIQFLQILSRLLKVSNFDYLISKKVKTKMNSKLKINVQ